MMLKFLFGALLLANLLVYTLGRGAGAGHEPARLANQLNANRIQLIPAATSAASAPETAPPAAAAQASPTTATAAATPAATPTATPTATAPAAAACIEIGSFTPTEASRFEARLEQLGLAAKASRREVPGAASYMVMIPPQGSMDAAERKTTELRALGITDSYIVQDASPRRWGIALGTFRTEEAANAHLATMSRRGVRTARVVEAGTGPARVAIQLRGLDAAAEAQVSRARAEFPRQESHGCS
jgi:cell division septation protein DedD